MISLIKVLTGIHYLLVPTPYSIKLKDSSLSFLGHALKFNTVNICRLIIVIKIKVFMEYLTSKTESVLGGIQPSSLLFSVASLNQWYSHSYCLCWPSSFHWPVSFLALKVAIILLVIAIVFIVLILNRFQTCDLWLIQ